MKRLLSMLGLLAALASQAQSLSLIITPQGGGGVDLSSGTNLPPSAIQVTPGALGYFLGVGTNGPAWLPVYAVGNIDPGTVAAIMATNNSRSASYSTLSGTATNVPWTAVKSAPWWISGSTFYADDGHFYSDGNGNVNADGNLSVGGNLEVNGNVVADQNGIFSQYIYADTSIIGHMVSTNFDGNGIHITNLNGTAIQSGTVNSNSFDAATKAQLALAGAGGGGSVPLNGTNTWTGSNTFSGTTIFTGPVVVNNGINTNFASNAVITNGVYAAQFIGGGAGLTGVNAATATTATTSGSATNDPSGNPLASQAYVTTAISGIGGGGGPASGPGMPTVRQTVSMFEEFTATTISTTPLGQIGLAMANNGVGTVSAEASQTGHPGTVVVNTVATNSAVGLQSGPTINLADGVFTNEWCFRITNLFTTADAGVVRLGFSGVGVATGEPSSGVYIRYDTNKTTFQYINRSSGTETSVDSGVTVVANTWYKGRVVAGPTGATFTINDASAQTITSNFPTTVPQRIQAGIVKPGTTAGTVEGLELDYCFLGYSLTTSR